MLPLVGRGGNRFAPDAAGTFSQSQKPCSHDKHGELHAECTSQPVLTTFDVVTMQEMTTEVVPPIEVEANTPPSSGGKLDHGADAQCSRCSSRYALARRMLSRDLDATLNIDLRSIP